MKPRRSLFPIVLLAVAVCLSAAAVVPEGRSASILLNGGFEERETGWRAYRATIRHSRPGVLGTRALRVEPRKRAGAASVYQVVPVSTEEGRLYVARAWTRGVRGARLCLRLRERSHSSVVGRSRSCRQATGRWQRIGRVRYRARASANQLTIAVVERRASPKLVFAVDGVRLASKESSSARGIWLSPAEIEALPVSGQAWETVKAVADGPLGAPDVDCQSNMHDVTTLAVALVAARTGEDSYVTKARDALAEAIGSEQDAWSCGGTRSAGIGRQLAAYVIAADVLRLPEVDPGLDASFRSWLRSLLVLDDGSYTVQRLADVRPSNVGTMPAASVTAVAAYEGDVVLLAKMAAQFRGWLGEPSSYDGFSVPLDEATRQWLIDLETPSWVAPPGGVLASIGQEVGGSLPAEMARGGFPAWCPAGTDYPYAALSGTYVQAELLYRAGYTDVYSWGQEAVRRTMEFLHRLSVECPVAWPFPAHHTYRWQPWLVNFSYGTSFPVEPLASSDLGFNMGFTDWTHAGTRSS